MRHTACRDGEGVAPVLCDRCAGVAQVAPAETWLPEVWGAYPVTTTADGHQYIGYVVDFVPGLNLRNWGINYGPYHPERPVWRLFTAGFLHANLFHIGMNMWCLWSLGRLSERCSAMADFRDLHDYRRGWRVAQHCLQSATRGAGASGAVFGLWAL